MQLTCLLATSDLAISYDSSKLSAADYLRIKYKPNLSEHLDWQTSRALKQYTDLPVISLSHSNGAAALLTGAANIQAGIDIEFIKERNFAAINDWILSEKEKEILSDSSDKNVFYTIWTIKEALLKASNAHFPADMTQIGLCELNKLHAFGQTNWHGLSIQIASFMIAIVWQDYPNANLTIQALGEWKNHKISIKQRW